MTDEFLVPEPFQFNPLKHHYRYIMKFTGFHINEDNGDRIKALVNHVKHIGSSVMDVYTGSLSVEDICNEIYCWLKKKNLSEPVCFSAWTGTKFSDYKTITLSDTSVWMLKYHNDPARFVHIFPARQSPHTFRIKANTLKSAVVYLILSGKDSINTGNLNSVREILDLPSLKDKSDSTAISELVEKLRLSK